jgi:chemotaxis protein methyltransferase CheR
MGINLSAYKSKQYTRRVESFIAKSGAINEDEFISFLMKDADIRDRFLDHLTINVSEFFRNKELFLQFKDMLSNRLMPERNTLKIWSAACSDGSEPYTLAIMLDQLTPQKRHSIIATDIDEKILQVAKNGIYTKRSLKNVDENLLNKYFCPIKDEKYEVIYDIKKRVQFQKHDLICSSYDIGYDAIVCRNVLIYFTSDAKANIYKKFYDALKPGGLLFIGATESIYNYKLFGYERESTFIYRKPGGK